MFLLPSLSLLSRVFCGFEGISGDSELIASVGGPQRV
jgi:hypothetical protein